MAMRASPSGFQKRLAPQVPQKPRRAAGEDRYQPSDLSAVSRKRASGTEVDAQ
jgi:hypothetical protein